MMTFLIGKRTYIIALGVAIVAGLHQLGYINDSINKTLLEVLAGGGLASMRAALSNLK